MAGGTPEHAALSAAVLTLLGGKLRCGRCRLHSADLRIRTRATGLATYPDAAVACGDPVLSRYCDPVVPQVDRA
jgi:Uma2 family endonuclease